MARFSHPTYIHLNHEREERKTNDTKSKMLKYALLALVLVIITAGGIYTATHGSGEMYATAWSLIPPLIAIVLALATREVYISLFLGILVGALFYSGFEFEGTVVHLFQDGMIGVASDADNVGILIFLVILGIMVCLINKAGGSAAFGRWASGHIKTRVGAQIASVIMGILIFIDDYFNCLTVGSVMRPVTDRHHISRAKLAYIIDSTAAPICIISPISSWSAAVAGFVEGEDSMSLFVQAIPYNFYALLTLVMLFGVILLNVDFGQMAIHERNAKNGDIYTTHDRPFSAIDDEKCNENGRVLDLVFPIICLIICCVIGIVYTGGFFSGVGFVEAFAKCNASLGLVLGSAIALMISMVYFGARRVLDVHSMMECIPEGFKAMVPSILILVFAWTLKIMTDSLGAAEFVKELLDNSTEAVIMILPAVIFVTACFLAFASGTSWGTFGILIPIVVSAFSLTDHTLMIIAISACMAGAVCGDHCSPISDTTIMSSAGAQCNLVNHVSTQLPYAITVAAISFVLYLVAGFVKSAWVCLPLGVLMVVGFLLFMRRRQARNPEPA